MRKATPKTGEEAAQLLAESRGAWIVSGGTTVMSNLLMSVLRPPKMLVSIERIEEAGRFDSESGWIGAGVRFSAFAMLYWAARCRGCPSAIWLPRHRTAALSASSRPAR